MSELNQLHTLPLGMKVTLVEWGNCQVGNLPGPRLPLNQDWDRLGEGSKPIILIL